MPRRALIAAVVLALGGTMPAIPAGADARSDRAALLLRIADLTDHREHAEAELVATALAAEGAALALSRARVELRAWAVDVYVHGSRVETPAGRVYAEMAGARTAETLTLYRRQAERMTRLLTDAETARDSAARDATALGQARARLDALVAVDDARRAAADAEADRARARANAAREAARAAAATAGPTGQLTPRHRRATAAQIELMARYPFGPGAAIPAGLTPTGAIIEGVASWYGPGFDGRATASGAIYDQEGWTVASRDLPLGTLLWVSRAGRGLLVLVNDRGPYVEGRVLDLSHAVATALGFSGIAQVRAQVVAPT